MAELKPCPFCGGEATPVYCENVNSYTSNILYVSKRGTVKCKRCELRLPRVYRRVSKAIEAWNRRADNA
jgi:Lar family restriction alleviation protein